MADNEYVNARIKAAECVTSFHQAMQDAGGKLLSVEMMNSMTVMEFITTIAAQNNIRFSYEKPEKPNE